MECCSLFLSVCPFFFIPLRFLIFYFSIFLPTHLLYFFFVFGFTLPTLPYLTSFDLGGQKEHTILQLISYAM